MRLAILFWFYDHLEVCADRLRLLRAFNPETPIYGLYGGAPEREAEARARLGPAMDDLWAFDEPRSPQWKWRHGDRLIAAWHAARGRELPWDTVAVVQWDMLLLAPLAELLAHLRAGEALFSGFRPGAEIEGWWGWLSGADPDKARELADFRGVLRERFGYSGELYACLFIMVALPRPFLDAYVASGPPEPGFLEYKLPTLARVFKVPVADEGPFTPWWKADPATADVPARDRVLNAMSDEPTLELILAEAARPDGRRAFHPVRGRFSPALLGHG